MNAHTGSISKMCSSIFGRCPHQKYILHTLQARYADEELSENEPDIQPDFTERFADEESAFQIHRFLHGMDEPYKEVFSLRVFGELPFKKIGAIFGKSSGWARVTFYRAKKQIIEYMEVMEHEEDKL